MRRIVVAVMLVTAGCATTATKFPSEDELRKLATKRAQSPNLGPKPIVVDHWDLEGTYSAKAQTTPHPSGPIEDLVASSATEGTIVDGTLACAASEYARFYANRNGEPTDQLGEFIAGRCGATNEVSYQVLHDDLEPSVSIQEIAKNWARSIDRIVRSVKAPARIGGSLARAGNHVAFVLASAKVHVLLEPVDRIPDAKGTIHVRGKLLDTYERVDVAITHGAFDSADCRLDPTVHLPEFAADCEVDRKDASEWIDVSAAKPNHFLGWVLAQVLVAPSGTLLKTWQQLAEPTSVVEGQEPFVALVNAARGRAQRPPLTVEDAETKLCRDLLPHYFAASGDSTDDVQDQVALGLSAGWDVKGPVRRGEFTSSIAGGTAVDLVQRMLDHPYGREVLLDAAASRIAYATYTSEEGGQTAGLATTYKLFQLKTPQEEEAAVVNALNDARAARGLEPVTWAAAPGTSAQRAREEIERNGGDPKDGSDILLDAMVHTTHGSAHGWSLVAYDLGNIHFPEDMLTAPHLPVVLAVAHYRGRGEPWMGYAIMFALPRPDQISATSQ